MHCYIVDGTNLYYRSFYAIRSLITSYGKPVNAVYGVFRTMSNLVASGVPNIVVAFDSEGKTHRHDLYPQYKSNRTGPPDELIEQIPLIYDLIKVMGIAQIKMDTVEADDIIGSLVNMCESNGLNSVVVSSDYDMYQLVSDKTSIYNMNKDGIISKDEVLRDLGVWPHQVVDMLALAGDGADSIPGVRGVGEKTAVKLLSQFGTIESIYENIDKISGAKLKERLENNRDVAFLSKQLATINRNIILPLTIYDIKYVGPDGLEEFTSSLEFRRLTWGRFNEQKINHNG